MFNAYLPANASVQLTLGSMGLKLYTAGYDHRLHHVLRIVLVKSPEIVIFLLCFRYGTPWPLAAGRSRCASKVGDSQGAAPEIRS